MSCPNCIAGEILEGEPQGTMEGTAYIVRASPPNTKVCLVQLTDIFGLPLVNCKLVADKMAKATGMDVWVPDIFKGPPPFKVEQLEPLINPEPGHKLGFMTILKFIFLALTHLPALLKNRSKTTDGIVNKFVDDLRKNKGYEKIGVFGYCFGGAATARLAGTDLINSAVVAHPAPISEAEIDAIKVPVAFVCAEEDSSFPTKKAHAAEALLERKKKEGGVDYEFKEYKGVVHGFAVRPALHLPAHKEGFEGAFQQTANWFMKTL